MAVQKGYVIQHVHEVWHFDHQRTGLFKSYVETWLQIKEEASGWPEGCTTPAQKQAHVDAYYAQEGIRLDPTKIQKNPGLRALAKMMLNSMWGKFGQRINKTQVREFTEPQSLRQFPDRRPGRSPLQTTNARCPAFTQSQHLHSRLHHLSCQTPSLSSTRSSWRTRPLLRHRLGHLPPSSWRPAFGPPTRCLSRRLQGRIGRGRLHCGILLGRS